MAEEQIRDAKEQKDDAKDKILHAKKKIHKAEKQIQKTGNRLRSEPGVFPWWRREDVWEHVWWMTDIFNAFALPHRGCSLLWRHVFARVSYLIRFLI